MTLLEVRDLKVHFSTRGRIVYAVDGASLDIASGETLGLVGESGCGKSTLGKAIVRLLEPTAGSIVLDGADISNLSERQLKPVRHKVQMIFQDPFASLNPRSTVGRIVEEPLIVNDCGTAPERKDRVMWLLERVGLDASATRKFPHEFSGGQRQRIGIARALALSPNLIVCDEAVSALDVSVRAQIINLLADLQDELGLSYLFISHDLSVVEHISDRVIVMYLGKIVESATRERLWSRPLHPYTQSLIAAVPVLDPVAAQQRERDVPRGDVPSPIDPPPGCRFHTRCPYVEEICRREEPPLRPIDDGQMAACHLIEEIADNSAARQQSDSSPLMEKTNEPPPS